MTLAQYVCPLEGEGCDLVVEVEVRGAAVAPPTCPTHDVAMLLAATSDPAGQADLVGLVYDEVAPCAVELLDRLRPWQALGPASATLAAKLTLALARLPERPG